MSYSWLSCGSVNEPTRVYDSLFKYAYQANWGTDLQQRCSLDNPEYTALVEQMGTLGLDDPKLSELVVEAYSILHEEKPFIPMVQAVKILPTNTTYWSGWPTSENFYNHPSHWWGHTPNHSQPKEGEVKAFDPNRRWRLCHRHL